MTHPVTPSPEQYDRADRDQRRVAVFVLVLAIVAVPLAVVLRLTGVESNDATTTSPAPVVAPVSTAPAVTDGVPFHGADGEPWCLPGAVLYDTEVPGWAGSEDGVVCRRGGPVVGPELDAAGPVSAVVDGEPSPDDDPALCSTAGNGQCGPGAPGGPVWIGDRYGCADPAATLITNVVGVQVCDYRLISTA